MTSVTKDQLDDFWIELIKNKDFMKKEEVHFFTHCTILNGRRSIDESLTITGYSTDLPALAPLAKDEKIKGIWFEIHPKKLPDKSPYGNCRLTFKAKHLMDYLSLQFTNDKAVHSEDAESQCHFIENNANVDDNEENACIEDVTISNRDGEKRLTKGYKLGQEYVKDDLAIGHNNGEKNENEEKYMDDQLENRSGSNETNNGGGDDDDDDDVEEEEEEEDDDDDDNEDEEEGEYKNDDDDDDDDDGGDVKLQSKDVIVHASTDNGKQDEGCLQLKDNFKDKENTINDVTNEGPEQLVFSNNKKSKNHRGINLKVSSNITLEDRYKKYKREDFLKDIRKPRRIIAPLVFQTTGPKRNPLLFLECCHFYENSQYVRFVLIRPTDSLVGWCYENLKPVDIESNPFFEYHEDSRQVFSSRLHSGWKRFFLDILVIGNIHLNNFRKFEFPNWDSVKKLHRAGRDPKIGFVRKKK